MPGMERQRPHDFSRIWKLKSRIYGSWAQSSGWCEELKKVGKGRSMSIKLRDR